MNDREKAKLSVLRENFFYFVQQVFRTLRPNEELIAGEYLELMCLLGEEVFRTEGSRIILNIPPRHLKSIVMAIAWPAWVLGHNPSRKILVACYGADLVQEQGRMFRTILESGWYKKTFPGTVINSRQNTDSETSTTAMGGRKGISVQGAATGFGADDIILDDLSKAADVVSEVERERVKTFYDQTLYTRLNNKNTGRIIAIQQRLHEDDLSAHLAGKETYRHVVLKAIAEEDESYLIYFGRTWTRKRGDPLCAGIQTTEQLRHLEREMSPFDFATQYQQTPTARGGNNIRWENIPIYRTVPRNFLRVVQSWDTAVTAHSNSDYSVCTTWGYAVDKKWYLLDVHRARYEFPQLEQVAIRLAEEWNADAIAIERQGAGLPLVQSLKKHFYVGRQRRNGGYGVLISDFNPRTDKEDRFYTNKHKLEQGNVLFPENAPWIPDLKHEMTTFPASRRKDQVDSIVQFFLWLESRHGCSVMQIEEPRRRRIRR
jgi:predicted phage terminase large subunit-like protein